MTENAEVILKLWDAPMNTKPKLTPKCDCTFKGCNGKTELNGVQFSCQEGQYTYQYHIKHWPIYAAAPALLAACELAMAALLNQQVADDGYTVHTKAIKKLRIAIKAALATDH